MMSRHLWRGAASDQDTVKQETMKPGTRLILSWLHGCLLNYPQVKNFSGIDLPAICED
jgi:hypothetical protein